MTEHELLLAPALRWAQAKNRPLDAELLSVVLSLRADHDEVAATCWPGPSVEHLLLVRWPAHGPEPIPDPDVLLATLSTYWRFLRATGRLAHGSAQPAELVRLARRALPRMAQACADPARQGVAKGLVDFGRTLGIDLDAAESVQQLQERFDAISTAWNELPDADRRRLIPALGALPHDLDVATPSDSAAGPTVPMGAHPAETGSSRHRLPRGDRGIATEQARTCAFTQACLDLARWVGEGRPVTATGVLRLAAAQEAYAALGLHEWRHRHAVQHHHDQQTDAPRQSHPDPDDFPAAGDWPWRSAADCAPLDRLWRSAVAARLVDIGKTRARATGRPHEDEDWLAVGMGMVLGLCQQWRAEQGWAFLGLLYLCALSPGRRTPMAMVRDWWGEHNAVAIDPDWSALSLDEAHRVVEAIEYAKQSRLDSILADFADTGLWERRGAPGGPEEGELCLTDFGLEFATVFGAALEDNWLPE